MTWSSLLERGSGTVRFAIVIEGWPEIWVTDASLTLTHATYGARGRSVRAGLLRQGIEISQRALLAQGKVDASGIRFRVRSHDREEHALLSFARIGQQVAELGADLDAADTSITLQGGTLDEDAYYHVGTEVIRGEATPGNITRAHWDTQAQPFSLHDDQDLLTHKVYDYPRTAEGRRITLYVWGTGDDATGYDPTGASESYGKPIWRGVVSLPPQLESDGLTWAIPTEAITAVFRQAMCARSTELRPIGIYHSFAAPLVIYVHDVGAGLIYRQYNAYYAANLSDFLGKTNAILAAWLSDAPAMQTFFSSLRVGVDRASGRFTLTARTVGSPGSWDAADMTLHMSSCALGEVQAGTYDYPWVKTPGAETVDWINGGSFDPDSDYTVEFVSIPEMCPVIGETMQGLTARIPSFDYLTDGATPMLDVSSTPTTDNLSDYNRRRIYVDRDWSEFAGANSIGIPRAGLAAPETRSYVADNPDGETIVCEVVDSGTDATFGGYWIELEDSRLTDDLIGWCTDETLFSVVYGTGEQTDVVGLIEYAVEQAESHANDGNVPFIRDTDFDLSTDIVTPLAELATRRRYAFAKQIALDEVIAEELKLIAYMWSFDRATAKPTFVSMPILTSATALTRDDNGDEIAIGSGQIQTPAGGGGSWPGYAVQSQGLVATVTVKTDYDAFQDEHRGTQYVVRDATLLSTHKRRGVTDVVIAPKSRSEEELSQETAHVIAARLMSVLGREYATVTISVNFTLFGAQLGDVVSLTSPHVPTARGTRGVTGKRCMVIGRRWNLDPGRNEHGRLELLTLLDELAGYTPSGVITSQSGSGTAWVVTLSASDPTNILLSPRGDGDVAGTFEVGDLVRVYRYDDYSVFVAGEVTAQSGATVSITFSSAWTPASYTWTLEYAHAGTANDAQRAYAFVADEEKLIDDSEQARRFG